MNATTVLLVIHVLAAIVWIGGMIFIALILAPVTRALPEAERTALFGVIGQRFSRVGWICLALLAATGTAYVAVYAPNLEFLLASRAGPILAIKLLFVIALAVLSWLHDFVYGPKQVELTAKIARGEAEPGLRDTVARLRRQVRLVAQLSLVLALIVVSLGVSLRWLW